ncbi:MAG: hypothetical protein JNM45_10860 [Rhizobiales bacterium]|nr:hypothetical protein [Hyphomicrobiales bacterium]
MNKRVIAKWAGLAGVGLLLAACGNNDAEIKAMAKKMHMSKQQAAAFQTCAKDMKSRKPIFIDGDKAVQLTKVPLEICACHAPAVAQMFKDDKLTGHARFAAYIGKVKRKELKMGRRDLRTAMAPEKAGQILIASFRKCASDFAATAAAAENYPKLIVPFDLPKPKPKKKKEGEDGEGEQHASAE